MGRRIAFRAWHKTEKKMYEVTSVQWSAASAHELSKLELLSLDDSREVHTVHGSATANYELMQYTGLHDRLGKEIYEGDIVKCFDGYNATVSYDEEKAEFVPFGSYEDAEWGNGVKVIGNIYDNPDLLPH